MVKSHLIFISSQTFLCGTTTANDDAWMLKPRLSASLAGLFCPIRRLACSYMPFTRKIGPIIIIINMDTVLKRCLRAHDGIRSFASHTFWRVACCVSLKMSYCVGSQQCSIAPPIANADQVRRAPCWAWTLQNARHLWDALRGGPVAARHWVSPSLRPTVHTMQLAQCPAISGYLVMEFCQRHNPVLSIGLMALSMMVLLQYNTTSTYNKTSILHSRQLDNLQIIV
ncbi:hypothetical protein V8C26DRAFT_407991 [Trichoderma gracile]